MTTAGTRPGITGTSPELVCRTEYEFTATAVCSTCSAKKPLTEMARDRSTKTGYRSQCRECRKDYDRRRYEAHPEIGWAADHRRRARSYGLQLVTEIVTASQVTSMWGDHCFYCPGPFEVIDHRIPVAAGGHHTVTNVVPCCRRCNQHKRWRSDERMIRDYRQGRDGHGFWARTTPTHVGDGRR
jgi:hypothetical protein